MVPSHRACGSAAGAALFPVIGWDLFWEFVSPRHAGCRQRQSHGRGDPGQPRNAREPARADILTRMRRLLVVACLALLIAVACGQQSQATQSHDLVLGAIYPLSGPQAEGGKEELAGVNAALQLAQST